MRAPAKPHKTPVRATPAVLDRAWDLREKRLSWPAIVAVLELDFGGSPCEQTLKNHLGTDERSWQTHNGYLKLTHGERGRNRGSFTVQGARG